MAKALTEKFVQDSIIEFLHKKGWSRNLTQKEGHRHGVDIKVENKRYSRYWLVEAKGDAGKGAGHPRSSREVSFIYALGQILTRMERIGKRGYKYGYKYGVGFPDSFEDVVVRRLPYDVCDKLNLYVFLVSRQGDVKCYDWKKIRELAKK